MRPKHLCPFLLVASIFLFHAGAVWCANLVDDTREAIRLGKYDRALRLLDAALDENPVDTNAHLLMTEYYLAIQDYGAAELSTERTLVLNRGYAPLVAQAYYIAGEKAAGRKQPARALALYETAVALDPAFRGRMKGKYMALADDLVARRRVAAALSAYNRELEINPAGRKSIAVAALAHGQSLLESNGKVTGRAGEPAGERATERAAEKLFSYAASLDPSCGPGAAVARLAYGLDLLKRAQAATGEERRRLREQSLRYVSKETADQALPPPVWTTVFRQEYAGRGMSDEDGVILTPYLGREVKPGDRIVVTGKEFQFFEDGWKTHTGTYETTGASPAADGRVGIRAGRGEPVTLEVQRLMDR